MSPKILWPSGGNTWWQWARFASTRCGSPRPPTVQHSATRCRVHIVDHHYHDLALLWCCQPPRWADLEVAVQVEHMPYCQAPSCMRQKGREWNAVLVTTLESINRPHSQDAESAFGHQYVLTIVHIDTVFCQSWKHCLNFQLIASCSRRRSRLTLSLSISGRSFLQHAIRLLKPCVEVSMNNLSEFEMVDKYVNGQSHKETLPNWSIVLLVTRNCRDP